MGKPLISDSSMRGMYETMQRLRALKHDRALLRDLPRDAKAALLETPESLAAAMVSQMHTRDTVLTEGSDPLLEAALSQRFPSAPPALHVCGGDAEAVAAVAAGYALKQQTASKSTDAKPVVLAMLRTLPALTGAMNMVEKHGLSLLVIAQGDPEGRVETQKRLRSTKVPLLPVDANDAIAICRVMQESMLRARHGWGGVVVHAARLHGAGDPLSAMEQHLRMRGLLPKLAE